MDRVRAYLTLCRFYLQHLGGPRWSAREDALVYADERYFVFYPQLCDFLWGLGKGGKLIPFSYVLHLLDLLRNHRLRDDTTLNRVAVAFLGAGKNYFNAGAFAAMLCREIPEVSEPPTFEQVCDRLADKEKPIRWFTTTYLDVSWTTPPEPPLHPADFEEQMLDNLAAFSDDDLHSWFLHGRGPIREAGEDLARQQPVPRTLSGVLAALLDRPRLAGAAHYVTQLIGALTLPPRRLLPQELPVGGYADVANQGAFEAILPAQFALEELEFFRRFAERELLFFRREEPPAQTRQEMIVLLDQGVRTWGDVRLVLAAAALALGKQALRRQVPFFLAATSNEGRILNPLDISEDELGKVVEASDLSVDPGLALESVLQTTSDSMRDVVLLTHPRNLRAPDLAAAARRLAARDRLFAVALDGQGQVEVSEFRHGAPIRVRQFRVAFQPAEVPAPAPSQPAGPDWTGDVEPIGFPFRFNLEGPADKFDFDYSGDHLLTSSRYGMLHLWKTDNSGVEVLPRGMWRGEVLQVIDGLVGVAGGFVVVGRLHNMLVAFYYQLAEACCAAHVLADANFQPAHWSYSWVHHCLLVGKDRGGEVIALDLDSRALASNRDQVARDKNQRVVRALDFAYLVRPHLSLVADANDVRAEVPTCVFEPSTGTLSIHHKQPPWPPFTPLADGRPFLRGAFLREAQCWNRVLAGKFQLSQGARLHLFQGPEGTPLAEYDLKRPNFRFALSRNGARLAFQRESMLVDVRPVHGQGQSMLTRSGGFSQLVSVQVEKGRLILVAGENHVHKLDWTGERLTYQYLKRSGMKSAPPLLPAVGLTYDQRRFLGQVEGFGLRVVLDRFGQAILFDRRGVMIAMVMAFRDRLALWLPDGSCAGGSPSLLRRPADPKAMERLYRHLRDVT